MGVDQVWILCNNLFNMKEWMHILEKTGFLEVFKIHNFTQHADLEGFYGVAIQLRGVYRL